MNGHFLFRIDYLIGVRSSFGTIKKEPVSLEEKLTFVLSYARKNRRFSFRQMLEYSRDRMEIVVSFLAVLELMKVGRIRLSQASIDDDMYIEALEPEEEEAPENFREEGSGSES